MPLRVFSVLKPRQRPFAAISALAPSWARGPLLRLRFCRRGLAMLLPAALLMLAPAALASTAQATTLTVTTTADELTSGDGQCSLREAIAAANSPGTATDCGTASSTLNTIVVPAGRYALSIAPTGTDDNSTGDLNVIGTTPLTITGAGASASAIDATGLGDRVLSIASRASVTLKKLEITGGHAPNGPAGACVGCGCGGTCGRGGSGAGGGGIYNAGTLSLVGVGVVGNTAGSGGRGGNGICVPKPPCFPPGGAGGGGGGGGGILNGGTMKVTRSAILNNTAGAGGPGGYAFGPGGGGGNGGGISDPGTLVISRSTIAGNTAGAGGGLAGGGGFGGGISVIAGSLQVTNSTLTGNDAGAAAAPIGGHSGLGGDGGAIAASRLLSATLVLNATIANNAAGAGAAGTGGYGGRGGGIHVSTASHGNEITLQNTIVASNNANGAANCDPSSGVANGGHDLSYGDTSCPGGHGNPMLLALADNGGPTQTMALGTGSAAIDQVPPRGAGCPTTDQRGAKRPDIAGTRCDIGAFESTGVVGAGQITGTVADSATSAPLGGICVRAYDSGGGVLASSQTDSSGAYKLTGVQPGSAKVGFSTGCGAGEYITQYYNDKASFSNADPVTVTAGATTSGIDAAMVKEGRITGTVRARATGAPIAGICVETFDSTGSLATQSLTNARGGYSTSRLPSGSYTVEFGIDCSSNRKQQQLRRYLYQYYKDKSRPANATPVAVKDGITTSGIDAAMRPGGKITGTVRDRATGAPLREICETAYELGGRRFLAQGQTNPSGVYTVIGLPSGAYQVSFWSCYGHKYLTQYYKNKTTPASANPVSVTAGATTSGINAAMSR